MIGTPLSSAEPLCAGKGYESSSDCAQRTELFLVLVRGRPVAMRRNVNAGRHRRETRKEARRRWAAAGEMDFLDRE